jgi:hypothetical protein
MSKNLVSTVKDIDKMFKRVLAFKMHRRNLSALEEVFVIHISPDNLISVKLFISFTYIGRRVAKLERDGWLRYTAFYSTNFLLESAGKNRVGGGGLDSSTTNTLKSSYAYEARREGMYHLSPLTLLRGLSWLRFVQIGQLSWYP